jgi:hypothetical protein
MAPGGFFTNGTVIQLGTDDSDRYWQLNSYYQQFTFSNSSAKILFGSSSVNGTGNYQDIEIAGGYNGTDGAVYISAGGSPTSNRWKFDNNSDFNLPIGGNINNVGNLVSTSSFNLATGSIESTIGLIQAYTQSVKNEVVGIQAYTHSLKSVALVSSSQQILDYSLFALTASNNTFYGENRFENKVTHTNGYIVLTQVSQSLNFADDEAAAASGIPLGGLYRNGNFIAIRID